MALYMYLIMTSILRRIFCCFNADIAHDYPLIKVTKTVKLAKVPKPARREGYLYILKVPNCPDGVLKIGRTHDLKQRLRGYPKDTVVLDTFPLDDVISTETICLSLLRKKYKLHKGREYFWIDHQTLKGIIEDASNLVIDHE